MSITMPDGRTYTYLSDGLMVNGRRVTEARVDGALVYPRDEWPYWVRCSTTIDYHHWSDTWWWDYGQGKYVVGLYDKCDYHVEASISVRSRLPVRVWTMDREVTDHDVQGGVALYPMECINLEPSGAPDVPWGRVMRSSIDLRWRAGGFFGDVPERHLSAEGAGFASLVAPPEWGGDRGGFNEMQVGSDVFILSFILPGRISYYDHFVSYMSFGFAGHARWRYRHRDTPDGQPVYGRQDWDQTCAIEHSPSPWATADEYRAAFLAALAAL